MLKTDFPVDMKLLLKRPDHFKAFASPLDNVLDFMVCDIDHSRLLRELKKESMQSMCWKSRNIITVILMGNHNLACSVMASFVLNSFTQSAEKLCGIFCSHLRQLVIYNCRQLYIAFINCSVLGTYLKGSSKDKKYIFLRIRGNETANVKSVEWQNGLHVLLVTMGIDRDQCIGCQFV